MGIDTGMSTGAAIETDTEFSVCGNDSKLPDIWYETLIDWSVTTKDPVEPDISNDIAWCVGSTVGSTDGSTLGSVLGSTVGSLGTDNPLVRCWSNK